MNPKYSLIPLETLTNPYKEELLNVYKDRYWVITENNEAVFFRDLNHPQCNSNQRITENLARIAQKDFKNTLTTKLIPWAFVPFIPSETNLT